MISVWLTFLEGEDKPLFGGTILADERFAAFEDAEVLEEHLRHLWMLTGSRKVGHFIRKQPELLLLPLSVVAERMLELKVLLPAADLSAILLRRPDLLLCKDIPNTLGRAVRQMRAFMPASFERRLHTQDNLWHSFESVLPPVRQTRQDVHWLL
ncbi:hypothetical protein WJX72_006573 [[Myrmecia] bisecta]|uniref:Maturase K n=1 Tax=[Myrmecia] bisecta TaxID=41462 RepID=A0AAW1R6G3_9CHLO